MKRLFLSFLLLIASAVASAQNCAVNPGACQTKPVPSDCPAGQHWTTMGSGIAHCVANDPPCNGTVLHDAYGNPTGCKPPTPTVTNSYYNYYTFPCPSGQTGTDYERYKVTNWSDGTTTYGDWEVITYTCTSSGYTPPPTTPTPTPDPTPTPTPDPTPTQPTSPTPTPDPTPTQPTNPTPTPDPQQCSNGATNYPSCTTFPGCPYAGQVASSNCYFDASNGNECLEGDYVWAIEYYNSDASCSVRVEEGRAGGYSGQCAGRPTTNMCPKAAGGDM